MSLWKETAAPGIMARMDVRGFWPALRAAGLMLAVVLGLLVSTPGGLPGRIGPPEAVAAGEAWVGLSGPPGAISLVAVDPLNPNSVYAVSVGGGSTLSNAVYRSADGGGTWTPLSNNLEPVEITSMAVRPGGAEVLLGTADGIRRTLDGGQTWLRPGADLGQSVSALAIVYAPNRPDYVYALARENTKYPKAFVYRSSDGGATWKAALLQQYPNLPTALAVDPAAPNVVFASTETQLYKSTDGGVSWGAASAGLPTDARIAALAADPSAANTLYAAVQRAATGQTSVYRTSNGGAAWAPAGEASGAGQVAGLCSAQGSPPTLHLGGTGGVYRSTSGGQAWQPAYSGPGVLVLNGLACAEPRQVWAATGNGLYRSGDAGATWALLSGGLPVNSRVRALAASARRPGTLYAGTEAPVGGRTTLGLLKSVDGGVTWQPSNAGLTSGTTAIAVDPRSPDIIYAGTYDGLFKSTDGGARWARLPLASQYRAADGTIRTAGGAPIVLSLAIDPANPDVLYAGQYNFGLYRSTDGGASWTLADLRANATTSPSVHAIVVDPTNPGRVYAATGTHGLFCAGAVYRSDDAGLTWQRAGDANNGLPACEGRALAIDSASPPDLVLGAADAGVYRSADGGQTWAPAAGWPANNAVAYLLADPVRPATFYAAREGGNVYRSDDGGTNWYSISAGLGDNQVQSLAIDPSGPGHPYAATEDGGIWQLRRGVPDQAAPPAVDARIEIVWPHDGALVTEASLANVGVRLFMPDSLAPTPCRWTPAVSLWASVNSEPPYLIGTGQQRTVDGNPVPYWEFNDVDVSPAQDPANRMYFWVTVDGVPARRSVWSHGADARTFFPVQDTPEGNGPITEADARIEIVWPHDRNGQPQDVAGAALVNVGVDVYQHGTVTTAPTGWSPTVRLWRSLNNGTGQAIAVGHKGLITAGDITYPRWSFNDVDVSATRDPLNKYYFWESVE